MPVTPLLRARVAVSVLFALRQPPKLKGYVSGTLVFGLPVIASGLHASLVRDIDFAMAWSALGFGLAYIVLAWALIRSGRDSLRLLAEAFAAIGVIFASLAVPLAFDERATALIELAHPQFRAELFAQAQAMGYLSSEQTLHNLRAYPVEEELTITLKDGRSVMLRPAKSTDADGIRDLFHHLTEEDVYTRFFRHVRGLSEAEVQRLCNVNYESEVAFVATAGSREESLIVGQSCYFVNPTTNLADTAFMVHPEWQGTGLGAALQACMVQHAVKRGLRGFVADILPGNQRMLRLARSGSQNIKVERRDDSVHVTMLF